VDQSEADLSSCGKSTLLIQVKLASLTVCTPSSFDVLCCLQPFAQFVRVREF
jgi:hypothetical protein